MGTELVKVSADGVPATDGRPGLPVLVERAGGAARFAWEEFFYAEHQTRILKELPMGIWEGLKRGTRALIRGDVPGTFLAGGRAEGGLPALQVGGLL